MRILKDIKLNINKKKYVGKIVIKDDCSVDGIVIDISDNKKYLVMGSYENNVYNLVLSNKNMKNKILITTLVQDSDKLKYKGELYTTNGYKKQYMGNINSVIIPADYFRDVNEGEIISLLDRVHIMKYDTPNLVFDYLDKMNDNNNKKIYIK